MIDKQFLTTELSTRSFTPKMRAKVIQKVDSEGKQELDRVEFEIGDFRDLTLESERELKHFHDLLLEVRKLVRDGKE